MGPTKSRNPMFFGCFEQEVQNWSSKCPPCLGRCGSAARGQSSSGGISVGAARGRWEVIGIAWFAAIRCTGSIAGPAGGLSEIPLAGGVCCVRFCLGWRNGVKPANSGVSLRRNVRPAFSLPNPTPEHPGTRKLKTPLNSHIAAISLSQVLPGERSVCDQPRIVVGGVHDGRW